MIKKSFFALSKGILVALFFVAIPHFVFSQNNKLHAEISGRLHDEKGHIDPIVYKKYEEKANKLFAAADLELKKDWISIVGKNGNIEGFKKFLGSAYETDKREAISLIGENKINTTAEFKVFADSKVAKYKLLYKEYLNQQKTNENLTASRAPQPFSPGRGPGQPCQNMDFESQTLASWTGSYGSGCDPVGIAGFNNLGINSATGQHTIMTGGTDPNVPIIPCVMPGGTASLRLGDPSFGGNWAARISQVFQVQAGSPFFTYNYAVILQDAGHILSEQPYFRIRMYNGSGALIDCATLDVDATNSLDLINDGLGNKYKSWTQVVIPLQPYIGQNVTIEFTTADCNNGPPNGGSHDGYAYIDCSCTPPSIFTSSPTICGGTSVNVSAPAGLASYSWTGPGIVGATNTQTITVNAAGTYSVTMQTNTTPPHIPCSFVMDTIIPGNPSSPVAQFTSSVVCQGATTVFTDQSTPAGSLSAWAWDFDNNGTTDATTQNPTHVFPASGTFPVTLTVTWGSCTDNITANVTVNPGIGPLIIASGPFCVNDAPVNLVGDPTGGTWAGTGITNTATGTFSPPAATVGINNITYTVAGACAGTANSTITVNPLPISEAGPMVSICSGIAASIGTPTTAGYTYSWLPATGLSAANISNPSITTVNSGATAILTTYTVTTTANNCSTTDTVTVIVNPQPVLTITNPAAVCAPNTVDITAAAITAGSTGGGTLSYWTNAGGTIALAAPNAIAASGTYYIKVTAVGGCTDIDPVIVTINPLPISEGGPTVSICSGSPASIGTASTAGYTYSWLPATGLSASNISNPSITTTNSGSTALITTYTVTTTLNSCSTTDTVTVIVNPLPVLTITNPAAVCAPNTIDITVPAVTAGSTGGGTLSYWTNAAATIALAAPNAIATSGTYYIKVTAAGGCTDIDPVVVTINPPPVSDAGPDVTICSGTAASIGSAAIAGNAYSWQPATGLSASNISNPSITTTNPGTTPIITTYTVTTTVALTGCTSTDSVIVTVNPQPVLTITDPAAVCSPNTVDITASSITTGSTGGGIFTYWTDAAGTIALAAPTAISTSGTYYIKVTASGGCTDIDPVIVTINPPPVSDAGANVTICSGVAASIGSAPVAGNSYSWLPAAGLSASNISNPSITTTNPGTTPIVTTYTVTTTITLTGCSSIDSVTVTVNPQPVLTITDPAAVCAPAFVDITLAAVTSGSTGGGLLSYWTDAAGTIALAAPTAVTISGTYYIKVTASGGCTDIDPVVVTINPLPVSDAGTDVTICSGTAAGIGSAAVAGNTYSWLPATGLSAANIANPSITTTNPGTTPIVTTYTVTTTISLTGCFTTDSVTVTVNPQPVLTVTDPGAVCFPNIVDITAPAITAGSTGGGLLTYWNDAAATIALAAPTAVTISGTYYIQVTASGGCTDINPVIVVVNPLPVSNAGSDAAFCTGLSANLGAAATAGNTYSWLPATGLTATNVANPTTTTTNSGTTPIVTTYTVTTTISATGCSTSDSVVVTVHPLPVLTIVDPSPACSPGTIDITAPAVTAGTIGSGSFTYWTDAAGTIAVPDATAINATGTYYIEITSAAGCTDINPVNVVINPLPVSNAGLPIFICSGSPGMIGAAAVAGYSYLWTPSTGLTSDLVSSPVVTLTNTTAAPVATTYTVTTTNNTTGCSSSATVVVTVYPAQSANAGSSQYVCTGMGIQLAGTVGGSATGGSWSGGGGTFSPNNNDLNAIYYPTSAEYAAGSVILTLTSTDPFGGSCFSYSNQTFYFYPKPVADFSVVDPNGCPIVCASFADHSSVTGGDVISTWDWNFGDGSIPSNAQNPQHCYPQTGLYDVTLIVTSNHSCKDTLTRVHAVEVYPNPVAEFTPDPNPASILNPLVTLNNASSSDVTNWYYYFGDGDSISSLTPSPVHMYPTSAPETYTATLYVRNSYNCWDTIQHDIVISPEFTFYIPNAFTPNEDGVNDYFYGQGIGIEKYDIYIFDRWGNLIYHGDNIYASKWDGRANHGDDVAQQDVYVWKVRLTDVFGKKHDYIGTVTLVK